MNADEEDLLKRANAELESLGVSAATVTLDLPLLIALIGIVQLGLRHPSVATTSTAIRPRAFIKQLIEDIAPADGALRELLMKGFDPEFDIMHDYPRRT